MNHDKSIKQKRSATVFMALVMCLALVGTSWAADPIVREMSEQVYAWTAYDVENSTTYTDTNYVQYEEVLDEETLALLNNGVISRAAPRDTFNFTLDNDVWSSGAYWTYRGNVVTISASVNPTDVEIKVGVVDPNGVFFYNKGSDVVTSTYTITQTGYHQVLIKNETDNTVSVIGFYSTSSK